jgi:hypothetical protein
MYSFKSETPGFDELTFRKGDLLAVLDSQKDGWCQAVIIKEGGASDKMVGSFGLAPGNYLRAVPKQERDLLVHCQQLMLECEAVHGRKWLY